jgi:signal transduction histidine kinase
MRLRTKLAVVLVVAAALLSGGVYAAAEWYEGQQVEQASTAANETAGQVARQLGSELDHRGDTVRYYAVQLGTVDDAQERRLLRTLLQGTRFMSWTIVDANGTVAAHDGVVPANDTRLQTGSDVSGESFFGGPIDPTQPNVHVGEPRRLDGERLGGDYYVTVSASYFEEGERRVFTTTLVLGPETTFTAVEALDTSTQSASVVANGETVFRSGQHYPANVSGQAAVPGTDWTVVVSRDRAPLQRQRRGLAFAQAGGVLGVLVLVGAFGTWEYRTNLRQTERLLDGFERVKEHDYDHTVDLTSGDEWERIGRGYNELTEGLQLREQALQEREQRLNVLNRVLRHNLRNEMTVVVGHAEFVEDETDDDLIAESARAILSAGADLTSLSQRAREIEEVRKSADETAVQDATEVVQGVVREVREEHPDVDVTVDVPESAPFAAVPTVEMAVQNVVANACEHNTGDSQRVLVTVTETDHDGQPVVWVTVQDDGPGIPSQDQAVLEKGRETALEHGSGLGLWLVYWVVQESDGDLTFDVREGEGTKVTLEFRAGRDDRDGT